MWPLRSLKRPQVETICAMAEALARHPAPRHPCEPLPTILPSSENSRSLDQLMIRHWLPDKIRLLRHVQSLSQRALSELAALFWFGRGDAPLQQLLPYARESTGITLPYYLVDSPQLAGYLRTALQRLDT